MTAQEFNALPEEARHFIQAHAGCLSCGNKEIKLSKAYELYKINKMVNVYVLFGGGINYAFEGRRGVLYNVRGDDSASEIRVKLEIATRIKEVRPEAFVHYDRKAIDELLASLPEEETVDLLTDEEKVAQGAWAERSGILGIDTLTADYASLKAYASEKNLVPAGLKKSDLIDVINSITIADSDDLA